MNYKRVIKSIIFLFTILTICSSVKVAAKGSVKYIDSNKPIKLTQSFEKKKDGTQEKDVVISNLFDIKVKCYGKGGDYEDNKGNTFKYMSVKKLGFKTLQGSAVSGGFMYIAFTDKGKKNKYQSKRDLTLIAKIDLTNKTVCPLSEFHGIDKLDLYGLGHANDFTVTTGSDKIELLNSAWYLHHKGSKKKDKIYDNRIGIYNSKTRYSYGGNNIVNTGLKGLKYIFGISPYKDKRMALGTVVVRNDKKSMFMMSYKFKGETSYEKGKRLFVINKKCNVKKMNYNVAQCMDYNSGKFYIVKFNEPKLEEKKEVKGSKKQKAKIQKENKKIEKRNKAKEEKYRKKHNNVVEIYKKNKKKKYVRSKIVVVKDPKIGNKNWKKDKWEVECFKYRKDDGRFYYTQYHPVKKQKIAYLFSCKK